MTEADWLSCERLNDLLNDFPAARSRRKLHLFSCECFQRVWHLPLHHFTRQCVEFFAANLDGQVESDAFWTAWERLERACFDEFLEFESGVDEHDAVRDLFSYVDPIACLNVAMNLADGVAYVATRDLKVGEFPEVWERAASAEKRCQIALLRDIFGDPFRPVAVDPAWLAWNGGTVVALGRTIYEDRRFELMPILGDALQDAGCHDEDMLTHCRGDGPHVRGCWVVDLLLGKE